MLGEVSLIWEAFNYVNNILQFLALESNYFKVYHYIHICKFKMLSMSLIFFMSKLFQHSLWYCCSLFWLSKYWAILVIGMFSTVWWNIFEFHFMSGGIFSTGKNGVENFLSKILVSKIFHRWLSNIFHCWWIHLSKTFCRKLYVFPNIHLPNRDCQQIYWQYVRTLLSMTKCILPSSVAIIQAT